LRNQVQTEQEVLAVQRRGRAVALDEARAQLTEAEARVRIAEQQLQALTVLSSNNATSPEELRQRKAEVAASRATGQALRHALARLEQDRLAQQGERRTRIARLEREAVEIDGEASVGEAVIRKLEYALEARTIRAPVSGRVGAVGA